MSCMCGDTYCWSCGPAQGNWHCDSCGAWAEEGGCEDPIWCSFDASAQNAAMAADYLGEEALPPVAEYTAYKQEAKDWCAVADAWRYLKTTMALNEWPLEFDEEVLL